MTDDRRMSVSRPFCCALFFICLLSMKSCREESLLLRMEAEEPLSLDDLSSEMYPGNPGEIGWKEEADPDRVSQCVALLRRIGPWPARLRKWLRSSVSAEASLALKVSQLTTARCSGADHADVLKTASSWLEKNTQVVGVLLPSSGEGSGGFSASVLAGVRTALAESGDTGAVRLRIRDTRGTQEGMMEALADLVFREGVTLLAGGLPESEAEQLSLWSRRLRLPLLLMNRHERFLADNPYVFQLYPGARDLTEALAAVAHQRGFRNIAVLHPQRDSTELTVKAFIRSCQRLGIRISQTLSYLPGDFASMNQAVASVSRTLPAQRPGEYRRLLDQARHKAEAVGQELDHERVLLSPDPLVDAVFLPDHFRSVRYFIKLFRYHGLTHFPLIGTQEWRSGELIEPWDPFLKDSFFSDFVGSYQPLLEKFRQEEAAASGGAENFVEPARAAHIDLSLIGYRACQIALELLKNPFLKREDMFHKLLRMQEDNDLFHVRSFHKDRKSRWPSYVFGLDQRQLFLIRKS
ncbi:MAG: ABC transporter substrate-binding protein [Deltaproteobacteria bacterium]|nr:ABC transporter substrate-binding protein [Deltaproteobacteria bacterium]